VIVIAGGLKSSRIIAGNCAEFTRGIFGGAARRRA